MSRVSVDTGEGHAAHIMKHFLLLLTGGQVGVLKCYQLHTKVFLCGVFSVAVAQRQSVPTLKLSTIAEFGKSSNERLEL